MVQRDTPWPPGTPCWVDLSVDDPRKAKAFYSALFGWEALEGPPEAGGYLLCTVDGQSVAGIGPKMGSADEPSAWTTYLASENADETAGKISAAGGQVFMPPFDVMDVGRMCVAADPGGAVFGVWQAAKHTGMQLANEPGAVCWNENMSRDFDANKAFYHAVFGYQYDDMSSADFRYATFRTTGDSLGGIGALDVSIPADVPAHWMTYFTVTDADHTLTTATSLGGQVVRPAWDTPYGRMAILSDDQGAVFALMGVPASGAAEG
jgi:predicted enzyme related to lactoylglutathione lyase